ncbi:Hsp33 family molecular chaperone [Salinarimonas soli]|uniref:Hsp33 family molecular chaperone n=1 Tax=Salinarimonas soli TaxID=1638099 RepID=A0A5B2VD59_9HYPH|nr:Hsp33 family molecular chaperone [Salinarimonas soli]KAA2236658.1 Hsp33 family molecular chaperone [Salinarimonas soli]
MQSPGLEGRDDAVLPFAVEALDVRGRVVRLGDALDVLVSRHGYPDAVARVIGEAAALTALLGSSLKFDGRFQLQTKSDGPIELLVVDYDAPDRLRAYARFDPERVAAAADGGRARSGELLGHGHLALTIDQGPEMSRYQGVVALEGQGLEDVAHQYFRQSEQIPTRVRLAVAEQFGAGGHGYRAGGLMIQFLPTSPERLRQGDLDPGDAPAGHSVGEVDEDDAWVEARTLVDTVEDHELIDPSVGSERLLYRLFHERGVRVFEAQGLREACRCSRERVMTVMARFSPEDRRDMVGDDGRIGVTCEFCSRSYDFDPAEVEAEVAGGRV